MLGTIKEREEKLAYSIEEISAKTTLSKAYLRNEIRAGRLRVKRFGRRVLVLNSDLQAYMGNGSEGNKSVAVTK